MPVIRYSPRRGSFVRYSNMLKNPQNVCEHCRKDNIYLRARRLLDLEMLRAQPPAGIDLASVSRGCPEA